MLDSENFKFKQNRYEEKKNLTNNNIKNSYQGVNYAVKIKNESENKSSSLIHKILDKGENNSVKANFDFDYYNKKKTQNTIKTNGLINQVFKDNVKFLNSRISGLNNNKSNSTNKSNSKIVINSLEEKMNKSTNITSNILK